MKNLYFIFILIILVNNSFTIKWLGLSKSQFDIIWKNENDCVKLDKIFTSQQIKFCQLNPELMPVIKQAANQAIQMCINIFQMNRWNCTSILNIPKLSNDLLYGTREQAFVYALASSSFFYSIARKCASHDSKLKCGCGGFIETNNDTSDTKNINGCNDNVEYAFKKGTELFFVQSSIKRSSNFNEVDKELMKNLSEAVIRVNNHNYQVGYQLIKSNVETRCMCHGISASCNLKTCWQKIPSFEFLANKLKEKYLKGIEVKFDNITKSFKSLFKLKINDDDLIFVKKSPDYCEYDIKSGSLGTKGRLCLASSTSSNTNNTLPLCSYLCCRRGYLSLNVKTIEYDCNCKILYCCRPKCDKCKKIVEENYCL